MGLHEPNISIYGLANVHKLIKKTGVSKAVR